MTQKKKDTIKSLAIHSKDVGSTEIQVGLLTDKIAKLSEHFKKFKKDINTPHIYHITSIIYFYARSCRGFNLCYNIKSLFIKE